MSSAASARPSTPVTTSERIASIEALRGFAVLGILVVPERCRRGLAGGAAMCNDYTLGRTEGEQHGPKSQHHDGR